MKIKEEFLLREIAGNHVVVPIGEATLDFNGMMSLNETGAFLFEKLIKGASEEQLVEDLISTYDVERELAKKDVEDFIRKVEREDLFE